MIFTAESLHPKWGGPLHYNCTFYGSGKRSISESNHTPWYRWEILIPTDQEDTKAERRIKTQIQYLRNIWNSWNE